MTMLRMLAFAILVGTAATALAASHSTPEPKRPVDPGGRGGAAGAGAALPRLTSDEAQFFQDVLTRFQDVEVVTGGSPWKLTQRCGAANYGSGPRPFASGRRRCSGMSAQLAGRIKA
jgi:hypothetical protein